MLMVIINFQSGKVSINFHPPFHKPTKVSILYREHEDLMYIAHILNPRNPSYIHSLPIHFYCALNILRKIASTTLVLLCFLFIINPRLHHLAYPLNLFDPHQPPDVRAAPALNPSTSSRHNCNPFHHQLPLHSSRRCPNPITFWTPKSLSAPAALCLRRKPWSHRSLSARPWRHRPWSHRL
jgi:hypothetical protein